MLTFVSVCCFSHKPTKLLLTSIMKDIEEAFTDVYSIVESVLKAKARQITTVHKPIHLRTDYASSLVFTDLTDREFKPDEAYLSSFRDIYINKIYKRVRLDEWQLEMKFKRKQTTEIDLVCTAATFHVNRIESRFISGCYIKINLFEGVDLKKHLSSECLGYLRRLAKKKICEQSGNIAREYSSLISFVPTLPRPLQNFNYHPWGKQKKQEENIDPLSTLTPSGLQALEKLRYFVKRQQISEFVSNVEVSKQVMQDLGKIAKNRYKERMLLKQQDLQ